MAQPIQLKRTTSNNPPTGLLIGEPTFELGPVTRFWTNDGGANRLMLSSNPLDNALGTQGLLRLTGGTMLGALETMPPVAANDATNKTYVDSLVANLRLFKGTWSVAANTPVLPASETAGDYYIAVTANPNVPENAPGGIPGIGGQSIHNGDLVLWNSLTTTYELVRGGPITVADANALYIQKVGDTMTGPLVLAGAPTVGTQAANKAYVDGLMVAYLPLSGGVLTGPLMLPGAPTIANEAATKAYVDAHTSGVISFNTRTGAIVLALVDVTTALGFTPYNATNPANYQTAAQVTATVANYVPLAGGVMTGALTLSGNPTLPAHAADKAYVDAAIGSGFTGVTVDGTSITGNGLGTPLAVGAIDGGIY